MSDHGTLRDTHAAALRHGLADLPEEATLVGVVRRPGGGFAALVDENRPALGPPADLRDALDRRRTDLKMRGLCDAGAHNAAWEELDAAERYRAHLADDPDAREALSTLAERLRAGESLALVIEASTEKKHTHGPLLCERLRARLDG